jgi:uncharacterized protein (TIGR02145 family)
MIKKNSRILICLVSMVVVLMLSTGCTKKDNPTNNNPNSTVSLPVLTTSAVSNLTLTTASCGGNITSDGGSSITSRGVCWSIGQNPTITDNKTTEGTGTGSFTSTISGLSPSTTYYVRAYATNSGGGTGYGNAVLFATLQGVTDIDGNLYHTVTIGTQVWMVENLKTTKYRDGTQITNVTDATAWFNLNIGTGAYCNYNNDANNATTYGRLYNFHAVKDSRGLAPKGWHIPTHTEWTTLSTYLGGDNIAGGKLKETGITHWISPNVGATNQTGFTAIPGGFRSYSGFFSNIGEYGDWWSSTEYSSNEAWSWYMYYNYSAINSINRYKTFGYSVRCLKD